MTESHPLDRPVWHSLIGRHAHLSDGGSSARRYVQDVNLFGAAADTGLAAQQALAALVSPGVQMGIVEAVPPPPLRGARTVFQSTLLQMILDSPLAADTGQVDWGPLSSADAVDMLALAQLTRPGPFFARTGVMGDFIGIRRAGRLVAMTGERMKPDCFTEVSAVCVHPDWRGNGFGIALMRVVISRIQARGETAFLHVYADNPAVRLYRGLGFSERREMSFTIVEG